MGRLARVVTVDVPHHLTQRGNDRRFILDCDADRATYLSLLRENIKLYQVSVMGNCLMSNHVHLIVVPRTTDGLAQALKQTHGRYASYWNTVHRASGLMHKQRKVSYRWVPPVIGKTLVLGLSWRGSMGTLRNKRIPHLCWVCEIGWRG